MAFSTSIYKIWSNFVKSLNYVPIFVTKFDQITERKSCFFMTHTSRL